MQFIAYKHTIYVNYNIMLKSIKWINKEAYVLLIIMCELCNEISRDYFDKLFVFYNEKYQ